MNDTMREYCSYWKYIIPLLRVKKTIIPEEYRWGGRNQYFLFFRSPERNDAGGSESAVSRESGSSAAAPHANGRVLVFYIHGGGWNSHNPKQDFYIGQNIASQGYDCVMPCYRKTPGYRYDDIADDVFRGYAETVKYLAERDRSYEKIIVMGSSAGAHLGALLCFDRERQEKFGIDERDFAGLLSMAGPLYFRLPQTGTLNLLLKYLFNSKNAADWMAGEPYGKLHARKDFRLCMIQSRHDGLVGYEQAEAFCDKAKEYGIPSELYEVREKENTHSAYCAAVFLKKPEESQTLTTAYEMLSRIAAGHVSDTTDTVF